MQAMGLLCTTFQKLIVLSSSSREKLSTPTLDQSVHHPPSSVLSHTSHTPGIKMHRHELISALKSAAALSSLLLGKQPGSHLELTGALRLHSGTHTHTQHHTTSRHIAKSQRAPAAGTLVAHVSFPFLSFYFVECTPGRKNHGRVDSKEKVVSFFTTGRHHHTHEKKKKGIHKKVFGMELGRLLRFQTHHQLVTKAKLC